MLIADKELTYTQLADDIIKTCFSSDQDKKAIQKLLKKMRNSCVQMANKYEDVCKAEILKNTLLPGREIYALQKDKNGVILFVDQVECTDLFSNFGLATNRNNATNMESTLEGDAVASIRELKIKCIQIGQTELNGDSFGTSSYWWQRQLRAKETRLLFHFIDAIVTTVSVIIQVTLLSSYDEGGKIAGSVIVALALFLSLFSKLLDYRNAQYSMNLCSGSGGSEKSNTIKTQTRTQEKSLCGFMKMKNKYKHTVYFTIIIYVLAIYLNVSSLYLSEIALTYTTICYTIFFIAIEPILHDIDAISKYLPDINIAIDGEIDVIIIHPGMRIKTIKFPSKTFSRSYLNEYQELIKKKLNFARKSQLQLHCAKWCLPNGSILHVIGGVRSIPTSESTPLEFQGTCLLYMKKQMHGFYLYDDLNEYSHEWKYIQNIIQTQVAFVGEMV